MIDLNSRSPAALDASKLVQRSGQVALASSGNPFKVYFEEHPAEIMRLKAAVKRSKPFANDGLFAEGANLGLLDAADFNPNIERI